MPIEEIFPYYAFKIEVTAANDRVGQIFDRKLPSTHIENAHKCRLSQYRITIRLQQIAVAEQVSLSDLKLTIINDI